MKFVEDNSTSAITTRMEYDANHVDTKQEPRDYAEGCVDMIADYATIVDLSKAVNKGCLFYHIRKLGKKIGADYTKILLDVGLDKNQFTTYISAYKIYKKWPRFLNVNCNISDLQKCSLVAMYSVVVQTKNTFAQDAENSEDIDAHYRIALNEVLRVDDIERLRSIII